MKKFSLPGTLCKGETVGKGERFLGYLVGPLGFGFLSLMVNSYLNVYYTDVCGLGRLWGSSFMSVYHILVKGLGVLLSLIQISCGKARGGHRNQRNRGGQP